MSNEIDVDDIVSRLDAIEAQLTTITGGGQQAFERLADHVKDSYLCGIERQVRDIRERMLQTTVRDVRSAASPTTAGAH